jgi:tetratricopeptide (TPR) repeat protein
MSEFEYDENQSTELHSAIERFEEMLRKNKRYFFDLEILMQITDHFLLKDEMQKADEAVNLAVEQYPFSVESWLKKAQILIQEEKYEAALKVIAKAENIEPNDLNLLLLKSDCLLLMNQFQQAVNVLRTGMSNANEEEKIMFHLEIADVYFEWDNLDKSYEYVKAALQLSPTNEMALSRMWYLMEVTERFEESIEIHQKIIDEHPFCYSAWTNLSQAYSGLDLYEKALECCEYAIAINENIDTAYRDAGDILVNMKRYKDALENFAKVQSLITADAFLLCTMGFCHEQLKEYQQARGFYQRSIHLSKNFPEAYFQIAETYTHEGEWKKAIPYYRTATKMNENYLPYRSKLAYAMLKSEYYREAGKMYIELLEHNPKKKTWWKNLIKIYLALEKPEDAQFAYNQAISYVGDSAEFDFIAVAIYWSVGLQNDALLILENALVSGKRRLKAMFDMLPELMKEPKIKIIIQQFKK